MHDDDCSSVGFIRAAKLRPQFRSDRAGVNGGAALAWPKLKAMFSGAGQAAQQANPYGQVADTLKRVTQQHKPKKK
jgi:hypothetical protein